jgi:hypothetical protein
MYQAARGTVANYDALADLLESIDHFISRLNIYTRIPHTPALDEMAVKIIVELLSTLALATKEVKQGRPRESFVFDVPLLLKCQPVKFVKKLFGGNHVEAILQRLDRLTQDEARMTGTEILRVVHGLVLSVNGVMDGEQMRSIYFAYPPSVERSSV